MKILITGTNGFIGKNLIEYFKTREEEIYCPKRQQLNLLDSDYVFEYLNNNKFDLIIHSPTFHHQIRIEFFNNLINLF